MKEAERRERAPCNLAVLRACVPEDDGARVGWRRINT